MQTYLDLARLGRNSWWRFILAIILILFMWQVIGALPVAALFLWGIIHQNLPVTGSASLPGMDTPAGFIAFMLASVLFLAGIYLSVRFIHQRPFLTLITPARSIAWKRLFQGFGLWFLLAALMSLLEALLYPGRYVWSFDGQRFVPFVFLALIFIPIQTGAEELFFRAYLLQGFGLRARNLWVLCTLSGLAFGLPHLLNPEAAVNFILFGIYYFAFGFCLAYVTLRDGRLELALGAHAANNLFSVIFANYTISALPSPSLFTVSVLDAYYSVPAALVAMLIFAVLLVHPRHRDIPA